MDAPEISVYGEAKGEYTRQLSIFLTPCLETYFFELLDTTKKESVPQKVLWNFQNSLQAIPDWNQDRVTRETERIQKDCACDYLEELLTAVFIAHTKVLSAIRLTTKQKKLQITIPKLDHFLHRVLSECARTLWKNTFYFVETNSIEKQKNQREVSHLIQEAILQAIRGLLPVKSILREYLHDDEDEEETSEVRTDVKEREKQPVEKEVEEKEQPAEVQRELQEEVKEEVQPEVKEEVQPEVNELEVKAPEVQQPEVKAPEVTQEAASPTIYIDTKQSVAFTQEHVLFDSNTLEDNEIHDLPFAESELKEEEEEEEEETYNTIKIYDEQLPIESDEL